jgi:hypothetical protein
MGNAKSTSCSNSTSVTEQDLRITDYDMTIYEHRKERIFKGTIAICMLYAFIALLIVLTSYMYPTIKFIIFEKFLPFTIVFIVGTILLIIYLFYNILNFKPIKINKNFDYTNISCPDYWKLEYNQELGNYFDSNTINTNIFNYRCVLDPNIFSKTDIYFNQKNKYAADATPANAIGIADGSTSGNNVVSYDNHSKDSIDTDNGRYIVADLKERNNYNIINKITGLVDSNVYKDLVESSLLMNNYYFDSNASKGNDYNIYRYITQASEVNGFDTSIVGAGLSQTKKDELDIKLVASHDGTNVLAENTPFMIKKNIPEGGNYLDNVDIGNSGATTKVDLAKFPIVCNRVYPLLLAAKDKELSKNSSGKYDENVLRCAYSKMCGIPWSDMNCDKYDT